MRGRTLRVHVRRGRRTRQNNFSGSLLIAIIFLQTVNHTRRRLGRAPTCFSGAGKKGKDSEEAYEHAKISQRFIIPRLPRAGFEPRSRSCRLTVARPEIIDRWGECMFIVHKATCGGTADTRAADLRTIRTVFYSF